jgi:predicted CopG family antitoxin
MFEKRLQILIDEPRYRRLAAAARERRQSVSAVIREAIDVAFPADLAKKRAAWEEIKKAKPMDVPETVEELKAELEELHSGGL